MKLTIGQAAKQTGKSKSTISRAIKTGRLSANRDGERFEIDAAELFRVFDATPAQPIAQNGQDDAQHQPATPGTALSNTTTQLATDTEIRMLREMLERERETVDDLRERLTRAELMLTDARPKRRRFWPF